MLWKIAKNVARVCLAVVCVFAAGHAAALVGYYGILSVEEKVHHAGGLVSEMLLVGAWILLEIGTRS
jgi:hypothetical protein